MSVDAPVTESVPPVEMSVLMVVAAQAGMIWIAAGIFLLMLISAKSKLLLAAAGVGLVLLVLIYLQLTDSNYLIIGALFVIMLLIVKKDSDSPSQPDPYAAYGGYPG